MGSYSSDWADAVKRGVSSYIDVLNRLRNSRGGVNPNEGFDDPPPSRFPIKRWIPLLWGTF